MVNLLSSWLKSFEVYHLYTGAKSMTNKWFRGVIDEQNMLLFGVKQIPIFNLGGLNRDT